MTTYKIFNFLGYMVNLIILVISGLNIIPAFINKLNNSLFNNVAGIPHFAIGVMVILFAYSILTIVSIVGNYISLRVFKLLVLNNNFQFVSILLSILIIMIFIFSSVLLNINGGLLVLYSLGICLLIVNFITFTFTFVSNTQTQFK